MENVTSLSLLGVTILVARYLENTTILRVRGVRFNNHTHFTNTKTA